MRRNNTILSAEGHLLSDRKNLADIGIFMEETRYETDHSDSVL